MIDPSQTITAIASPPDPAARGIVRLSGSDVADVLAACGVRAPAGGAAVRFDADFDCAEPIGVIPVSVLFWPNRRSYTGEPSAELHTFGSLPILQAVVTRLVAIGGARPARPGEFTLRAFLAGRLDLTQAEAVLGVIEAEGRGALDHALSQLAGNLSRPLEQLRSDLLDLLADVEAGLDFVDEDIEFISAEALLDRLGGIRDALSDAAAKMVDRGGGASVVSVAFRGEPNAGKSRLINRICDRPATIVADVAGTTRDVVTVDTVIGTTPVQLIDTAGIEQREDQVSAAAQTQAERASRHASIRVWCVDLSRPDFHKALGRLEAIRRTEAVGQANRSAVDLWVGTKSDLVSRPPTDDANSAVEAPHRPLSPVSSISGAGLDELVAAIEEAALSVDRQEVGSVVGTAARCRDSIDRASRAISAAVELTRADEGQEFVAAELRFAAEFLGQVTGEVYTDDILDRVFGRFCIGK